MSLPDKHDRIIDDLRTDLEDREEAETWPERVEDAMNTAWDRLIKAGDPE